MFEKIKKTLNASVGVEKEALAAAEAISFLLARKDVASPLFREISEDLANMQKRKLKTRSIINTLPNHKMREVFLCKYIHGMNWVEIAETSITSITHAHRLHKAGLELLEKKTKILLRKL